MFKVNYSVLSYYPDIYLRSNLAIGVAFEVVGESYHKNEVKFITQRKKIVSFDDELEDLEFINMFLDGLKFEFEHTNQSLQNYIKRFVNNFYFEDIEYRTFSSINEVNDFINKTYKYILHLGLNKKERLNVNEKRKYVMTYLEGRYKDITSKHVVSGKNSLDKFTPDFVAKDIENKEFLFKFLNKNNTTIHNARSYILYSIMNEKNLILILEDDMVEEEKLLKEFINKFEAKAQLKNEHDLIKN